MLTQVEAERLIGLSKKLEQPKPINVVSPGEKLSLSACSLDRREQFLMDMNRGRINLSKCSWQERYRQSEVLIRLDVEGPPHRNPDDEVIATPHLHIYREGFGTKWAMELPDGIFGDLTDLARTLHDFLSYCNVVNIPTIQGSLQ